MTDLGPNFDQISKQKVTTTVINTEIKKEENKQADNINLSVNQNAQINQNKSSLGVAEGEAELKIKEISEQSKEKTESNNLEEQMTANKQLIVGSAPDVNDISPENIVKQKALLENKVKPAKLTEQQIQEEKDRQKELEIRARYKEDISLGENIKEQLKAEMESEEENSSLFKQMLAAADIFIVKSTYRGKDVLHEIDDLIAFRTRVNAYFQKNSGVKFSKKGRRRRELTRNILAQLDAKIEEIIANANKGSNFNTAYERNKMRTTQKEEENAYLAPVTEKAMKDLNKKLAKKSASLKNGLKAGSLEGGLRKDIIVKLNQFGKCLTGDFSIFKQSKYMNQFMDLRAALVKYQMLEGNKPYDKLVADAISTMDNIILNSPEFIQNEFVLKLENPTIVETMDSETTKKLLKKLGDKRMKRLFKANGSEDDYSSDYVNEDTIKFIVAKERISKQQKLGNGIAFLNQNVEIKKDSKFNVDARSLGVFFGNLEMDEDGTILDTKKLDLYKNGVKAYMQEDLAGMVLIFEEYIKNLTDFIPSIEDLKLENIHKHIQKLVQISLLGIQIQNFLLDKNSIGSYYLSLLPKATQNAIVALADLLSPIVTAFRLYSNKLLIYNVGERMDLDEILFVKERLEENIGGTFKVDSNILNGIEQIIELINKCGNNLSEQVYNDDDLPASQENIYGELTEEKKKEVNKNGKNYKYYINTANDDAQFFFMSSEYFDKMKKYDQRTKQIGDQKNLKLDLSLNDIDIMLEVEKNRIKNTNNVSLDEYVITKENVELKRFANNYASLEKYYLSDKQFATFLKAYENNNKKQFNVEANYRNRMLNKHLKYVEFGEDGEPLEKYREADAWNKKFIKVYMTDYTKLNDTDKAKALKEHKEIVKDMFDAALELEEVYKHVDDLQWLLDNKEHVLWICAINLGLESIIIKEDSTTRQLMDEIKNENPQFLELYNKLDTVGNAMTTLIDNKLSSTGFSLSDRKFIKKLDIENRINQEKLYKNIVNGGVQ